MAISHRFAMQIIDQRQHRCHVLHLISEPSVELPALDLLRHVLDLGLEISGLLDQRVCVDLVPQDAVPALECLFHQCHAVPEVLQQDQLLLAVLELSVAGHLHIEQQLQVVEFVGTLPNCQSLVVVLVHGGIAEVIVTCHRICGIEGALLPELAAEALQLLREDVDLISDLQDFLALQRQDLLLDVERHADDLIPLVRGLVQLCEAFMVHVMLLQELAEVPNRREELLHRVGGQLHISDVCHGGIQQLLVLRLIGGRWGAQAFLLLVDELHQGPDAVLREVLDELHVLLLPLPRKRNQGQLHWLSAHPQPVDVHRRLHVGQVLL
mmetsp:Transcript_20846/g.49439  ORF Transcript_20846/g.49439 Transcript_20846/m.49439 type:complete len:324 (+) Transcript_20846:1665-2636(+)